MKTEKGQTNQTTQINYDYYKISQSLDTCLYGIYDGHGGGLASAFCKANLLKYICESLDRITKESMLNIEIYTETELDIDFNLKNDRLNTEIGIRMKESCFRLNVAYCDSAKLSSLQIGSTAVVAMLYKIPLSNDLNSHIYSIYIYIYIVHVYMLFNIPTVCVCLNRSISIYSYIHIYIYT